MENLLEPPANDDGTIDQPPLLKLQCKQQYDKYWYNKKKKGIKNQQKAHEDYQASELAEGRTPLTRNQWNCRVYEGPTAVEKVVLQRLDDGISVEKAFDGYTDDVSAARREGRLSRRGRAESVRLYNEHCRKFLPQNAQNGAQPAQQQQQQQQQQR
jgi:hypothetical protein